MLGKRVFFDSGLCKIPHTCTFMYNHEYQRCFVNFPSRLSFAPSSRCEMPKTRQRRTGVSIGTIHVYVIHLLNNSIACLLKIMYCVVLYLYIFITLLVAHTNQERTARPIFPGKNFRFQAFLCPVHAGILLQALLPIAMHSCF